MQVCAALTDLPTERFTTEARVLAAEEARSGGDLLGLLLLTRYGATGLGLAGMIEPGLPELNESQLRAHAAQWFTRERAALWLTGPPPEGLRLSLPASGSGSPNRRAPQRRLPIALSALTRYPGPDVALSFEADKHGEALLAGLRILLERMEQDLRHVGGHSYDVDFAAHVIDGDTIHVTFIADAPQSEVPAVAKGMYDALHRLASDGPTGEELAHDLEGFQEHLHDPRSAESVAASAVMAHLHGEDPEDQQARLRQLSVLRPEQVASALTPALGTLLMLVPDDASDTGVDFPELPEGNDGEVSGRVHKRHFRSDAPRGSQLVSAPEGTTLRLPDGTRLTVWHDDCVAVGVKKADHPHLELVGADGLTLPLCTQDWKDGQAAVETAERATAAVPRYTIRPDSESE